MKNEFDSYVVHGDTATRSYDDGWTVTAKIVDDEDADIDDYTCYDETVVDLWKQDQWNFFGLILSVAKNGVVLDQHAASLWGIEGNLPNTDNTYFSEVFDDLEDEALERGAEVLKILNQ